MDILHKNTYLRKRKYPHQLSFVRLGFLLSIKGCRVSSDLMPVVWTYPLPINNILVPIYRLRVGYGEKKFSVGMVKNVFGV
jgi:hypothetical protein